MLCTESYLRRNAAKPGAASATESWLARSTKPVMSNLRKGNFQFHEQQVKTLALYAVCHCCRQALCCAEVLSLMQGLQAFQLPV